MDKNHTFSINDEINLSAIDDLIDSSAAHEAWTQLRGAVNYEDLFSNRAAIFDQDIISPFHDHINNIPIHNLLDPLKQTFSELSSIPRLGIADFSIHLADSIDILNTSILSSTKDALRHASDTILDKLAQLGTELDDLFPRLAAKISNETNYQVRQFHESMMKSIETLANTIVEHLAIKLDKEISLISTYAANSLETLFRLPIDSFTNFDPFGTIAIENALDTSGFSFAASVWSVSFLNSIARIHPKVQNAHITKKMFLGTKNPSFIHIFHEIVSSTPTIKKRWSIIERGLTAHQGKDFLASIPILLPQLEGLVTEAYILKKAIIREKKQIYRSDKYGSIDTSTDSRGNVYKKKIRGLGELVTQYQHFKNHSDVQVCIDLISAYLAPERNAILHGNLTNYATMKRSTRLVLVLFIMAAGIYSFTHHGDWENIPVIE